MSQDAPTLLNDPQASLIAFWIGPAQPFIAGARSLRDLWLGSVILSWLTDEAMGPIRDGYGAGAFLTPAVVPEQDVQSQAGSHRRPLLGRPNRFVAVVRPDPNHPKKRTSPERLAAQSVDCCKRAWRQLAERVHKVLVEVVGEPKNQIDPELADKWAKHWCEQIDDYLHVEAATLPAAACDRATLEVLLGQEWDADEIHAEAWGRIELVLRLIDARKAGGHFPAYLIPRGDVPQKCTLLGSFEQMGPARDERSREFWGQMSARRVRYRGTGINKRERLCAISLVKRFGWVAYLEDRFHSDDDQGNFPDTATLAAAHWLANGEPIAPKSYQPDWSGQWLHWTTRKPPKLVGQKTRGGRVDDDQADWNAPDEVEIPEELWNRLQRKRRNEGWPPAYYAILAMDVDKMHRWLQGDMTPQMGPEDMLSPLSRALGQFARFDCPEVVDIEHKGRLIYAGGDDVLAFLPLDDVIDCAMTLNERLGKCWDAEGALARFPIRAKFSAGIAIVHFKEDLRFALRQAREAEEAAKDREGDAVGIAVIRRSGEHTRVVIPWELLSDLKRTFLEPFRKDASDRWLYDLRAEEPTLRELTEPAVRAEIMRLADGVDQKKPRIDPLAAVQFWDRYCSAMRLRHRPPGASERIASDLADYLTLAQTMSFLTRRKD